MKKYIIFTLCAVCTFMFILSSCGKDSDIDDQEVEDVEATKIREKMKTEGIMKSLCEIIEHEDGSIEYQPRIGTAIYDVSPTVYYTTAESFEEVENRYYSLIGALNSSFDQQIRDKEITQGDIHLKFENGSSSEIARIKVDCPRLKDILTEIVFVPSNKWPENDRPSPFLFMSVWKQLSTGRIYVCVRKAQGGRGILLTFDGGWKEDWFKNYDHWQGQFYLWENTAQSDAFEALTCSWKYNTNKFNKMYEALQKEGGSTYNMINKVIKNKGWERFDNSYSYDHHLWWAYNCYDVTVYRTVIDGNRNVKGESHFFTHKDTPWRGNPSHAIYFYPDYEVKEAVWKCIYRGAS